MRVLMVVGLHILGGTSTVIENLADQLGRRGVEVTIGALAFRRIPPKGAYRVSVLPVYSPLKLKRFIDGFDVLHSHHPITNYLALVTPKPFVYHFHGAPESAKGGVLRFSMLLSVMAMKWAFAATIAVSENGAMELKKHANLRHVHVIRNGVNTNLFTQESDERFRRGSPQFLFVGNLYKHKNVEELVLALEELLEAYPKAHLQIVGGGHNYERLRHFVSRLKLDGHVELTGQVPDYELPYYYTSCDVYVTASRWELFGLPLLEAMACGKPVVASSIPPHTELVEKPKSGNVYSQGNIQDLCEKMTETYENRGRYGRNALRFARKHDWSVVAERVLKIYGKILYT